MPHDLPTNLSRPGPIRCQRCQRIGATICRLYGRKPSPFVVGLCDPCGDHFLMLDCRTTDMDVLKAEAENRLDEVEQMRQKCGGGWKKRPGKSRVS